ncbi:unnamed protein product [Cylicocyclus nassatus]|uniref:Uncharacterized protein n=1 Tax=Cylicocyclus nassatus TaxID=53992 RepID=A0AA36MFI3_CYLNA|nr:unnamed protein product [Cylicocyclus nassatus]
MMVNWLSGVVAQVLGAMLDKRPDIERTYDLQKLSATALLAKTSLEDHAFMGFCNEDGNLVQYAMLIETSITTFALFVIALYFAQQVKKKLNEPAFSKRTKQMQRRLSNMLLAQVCNTRHLH